MFNRSVLLTFCVILAISHFQDVDAKPPRKIIGGDDVPIEAFPSMVSLRMQGKHYCGGSLISNKHVLTAAHCAVMQYQWSDSYDFIYPASMIMAHVGTNSSTKPENGHAIKMVHVHKLYTGSRASEWNHDIAILTLTEPIVPNDSQKPIPLPFGDADEGEEGNVVGWGFTVGHGGETSETLKRAPMKVIKNNVCEVLIRDRVPDTQLCAFNGIGFGFCDGDSGGPFIVDNEIYGVVSNSIGCGIGNPDIYTRVYRYLDWINKILEEEK